MPRVIQVIESEVVRGAGSINDTVRTVRQYHSPEGDFLAEHDEFLVGTKEHKSITLNTFVWVKPLGNKFSGLFEGFDEDDGWYRMTLWRVMSIFGPQMKVGSDLVVEPTIKIEVA